MGVSSELRDGLRQSVELIANEVLARIAEQGVRPEQVKELPELGRQLTRESLRYLYRILFLLYAEARPELGILPLGLPRVRAGLRAGPAGRAGRRPRAGGRGVAARHYLYESLDLLFRKVQDGYRPRRTHGLAAAEEGGDAGDSGSETSEDVGLRFEPLHSKLFESASIRLIGKHAVPDPRYDADAGRDTGGSEEVRYLDTRLRNATLYQVLRNLMLTEGKKGRRGGFISYAQLGINQLGAVYEGLMSYSGFIANGELYEVAKDGDAEGRFLAGARLQGRRVPGQGLRTRLRPGHRRGAPGPARPRLLRLPPLRPRPADLRLVLHARVPDEGHGAARPAAPARPGRRRRPRRANCWSGRSASPPWAPARSSTRPSTRSPPSICAGARRSSAPRSTRSSTRSSCRR